MEWTTFRALEDVVDPGFDWRPRLAPGLRRRRRRRRRGIFLTVLAFENLAALVEGEVEELVRVLMHEASEQFVVALESRDELLRRQHPRAFLLPADVAEQLAQTRQQILLVVFGQRTVILQDALSERLAEIQGLQHRVGVAGVAEVLQPKVPLAVGNVAVESLLELGEVVALFFCVLCCLFAGGWIEGGGEEEDNDGASASVDVLRASLRVRDGRA